MIKQVMTRSNSLIAADKSDEAKSISNWCIKKNVKCEWTLLVGTNMYKLMMKRVGGHEIYSNTSYTDNSIHELTYKDYKKMLSDTYKILLEKED